uniref:Uncharacterized protein n=1 Tax=Meloidogyne incognita TaxID=6306 RepID=A0A914NS91_MELIC
MLRLYVGKQKIIQQLPWHGHFHSDEEFQNKLNNHPRLFQLYKHHDCQLFHQR